VFGTARIAPRENMFKWVGPLGSAEWRMYVRDDDYAVAASLDGLHGETISVYRSDVLSLYLHEHGYQVTEAENSENSLAALLAGRAKY
jgi:polar amino acid transport system substrate-binding protein